MHLPVSTVAVETALKKVLYSGCAITYTPPTMHHNGHQVVQPLGIGGVPGGVEEAELQGEDDAVGQLGVALQLLHVLEALQVQSQDHRQLLHTHPTPHMSQGKARHQSTQPHTEMH